MFSGFWMPRSRKPLKSVQELLAEVVVRAEHELAERRLEVVGGGLELRPVEERDRAHPEDVLPGVDLPGQVVGRGRVRGRRPVRSCSGSASWWT